MFQAGYLTIAEREIRFGGHWYRLRYPNHEVYRSLINGLLNAWTPDRRAMLGNKRRLGDLLLANDFSGMESLIGSLFAGIPNEWFTNPVGFGAGMPPPRLTSEGVTPIARPDSPGSDSQLILLRLALLLRQYPAFLKEA